MSIKMNILKTKKIIKRIESVKPKILVLGDVMLDQYISGEVKRISPEAPVPILNFSKEKKVLGGAGNVAHNLVNLGAEVSISTVVGNDPSGELIKKLLNGINVSTEYLFKKNNINTTRKTRFLSNGSQLLRLDHDSNGFLTSDYNTVSNSLKNKVKNFNSIIISDYNKGVCSELILKELILEANKQKVPVFIDPKGPNWSKYINATCITPNTNEVENELKLKLTDNTSFEKAAIEIKEKFKLKSCLITKGSNGMTYYDANKLIHQKVEKKEVFDVSGAGDSVIASMAASLSAGFELIEGLEFSSSISSEVVTHIGTTPFNIGMLKENG